MNLNKKSISTIAVAIMVTALVLSMASGVLANHTAEVDVTPTTVKGNSRQIFEFNVTNTMDSEDNIFQIWMDTECLSCPIAGPEAGENIENAGESLSLASEYLDNASVYLGNAASSKLAFGAALGGMEDDLQDAWASLVGTDWDEAADYFQSASHYFRRASNELESEPENIVYAEEQLNGAADRFASAGDVFATGATPWENQTAENLWNAASYLENSADNLSTGNWQVASQNLMLSAEALENAGYAMKDSGDTDVEATGDAIITAASDENTAGSNLWSAAENIKMYGEMLFTLENESVLESLDNTTPWENVLDALAEQSGAGPTIIHDAMYLQNIPCIEGAAENLQWAGIALTNTGILTGRWEDNLENAWQQLFVSGEGLKYAAEAFDNAGGILLEDLGGTHLQHIGSDPGYLKNAGDNIVNPEMVDLNTAAEQLAHAATHLGLAADAMSSTGSNLAGTLPNGWTFDPSGINGNPTWTAPKAGTCPGPTPENTIGPGENLTLSALMTAPDGDGCCDITVYTVDTGMYAGCNRLEATDDHKLEICYDSVCPTMAGRVYQSMVGENNLVGDEYDNGMATVELSFNEPVSSIESVKVFADNENVKTVPVSTTDNMIFTGEFAVEEWDDNEMKIVVTNFEDVFGNTCSDNIPFCVDTRAPLFDNECDGAGGNHGLLEARDTYAEEQLTGRSQDPENVWPTCMDTWTVNGQVIDNCGNCSTYLDNLEVTALVNGSPVEKATVIGTEFSADDIELGSDGLKSITIQAVDKTGNTVQETIENVFLDTSNPYFSGMTPENGAIINTNTPTVSVDVADSGLGVGWAELKDITGENSTLLDTVGGHPEQATLENSTVEWSEGVHTVYAYATDNMMRYCQTCAPVQGWTWENYTENVETCVYENGCCNTVIVQENRRRKVPIYENCSLENNMICDHRVSTSWWFRVDTTSPDEPDFESGGYLGSVGDPVQVGEDTVPVSGTIPPGGKSEWEEYSDLTVEIYVNGEMQTTATPNSQGRWEANIELEPGKNKVESRLIDSAGNASNLKLGGYVLSDMTGPTVTINAPQDGLTTSNSTTTLEAKVSDDVTPNKDIAVSIRAPNWQLAEQKVTVDSNGILTIDVPLKEGNNTISVAAKDSVGNVSIDSITVTRTIEEGRNWEMYATIGAIIAIILAAIAIVRRSS